MIYEDNWLPSSVISINQSYAFLQIPLVRHSGAFTDWLKFVPAVTYHFCLLFIHIFLACTSDYVIWWWNGHFSWTDEQTISLQLLRGMLKKIFQRSYLKTMETLFNNGYSDYEMYFLKFNLFIVYFSFTL